MCVCVTLVVTGILLNCFSLQGDTAPDCRPCLTKLCNLVGYPAWPAGRTCNFPFPNGMRLSPEPPDMIPK